MTTSTILYSIDTWFLRRQRLKEYAILTLTGYQQHYAMQADILPDIRTISIRWNSPSSSHRSFNINRYRPTTLANINEKTPFRYRFNKGNAMLDRHIGRSNDISNDINTIQFRWVHDIDQSMLEIGLQHRIPSKYAIMISFRYRYSYVGSI